MTTKQVLGLLADYLSSETTLVCSLGRTAEKTWRVFPKQTLFLDSMGDVTPVACGVALGLGSRGPVVALDTDGSHVMGLSFLPVLSAIAPGLPNLLILVLDNGQYESAGGLPTLGSGATLDWSKLGSAFGLDIVTVSDMADLEALLDAPFDRFRYGVVKLDENPTAPPPAKTVDGIESRYNVIRHLETILGHGIIAPPQKN